MDAMNFVLFDFYVPSFSSAQFLKRHFSLFIYFFGCAKACGILVPWPGIEFMLPAVEAWSFNHWTTREFPKLQFSYFKYAPSS